MAVPYRRVCSSHKEPIEGDATDLFLEYLAAFDRHKTRIRDLCDPPTTVDAVAEASPFYNNGLPYKIIQFLFERQMVLKNLALLVRDGLVTGSEGLYGRVDRAVTGCE
ncbi:MAG: hypothetical protein FJY85_24350 [Deltaproteobacteria bacterium]|nr:hypothetical protein [Deltaproteobacteria bacterium]